jgi:prepilin-type N-terminal cleavage/methylation domain-containing protein
MDHFSPSRARGFTILEISVVLMVIALLTTGVMVGQHMMRAAELRKVIADFDRISRGIEQFKEKFYAMPGDMTDAQTFWGTDPGGCPPAANIVIKTATCNGNNDGRINLLSDASQAYEQFRAWQHLANAGMLDGTYSGVLAPASEGLMVPDINCPMGIRAACYGIGSVPAAADVLFPAEFFQTQPSHFLELGYGRGNAATIHKLLMSPEEALSLDNKMDDGYPGQGLVQVRRHSSAYTPNCATTDDASTAVYNTASGAALCGLFYFWGT